MFQVIGSLLDSVLIIGFVAFAVWVYPRVVESKIESNKLGPDSRDSIKWARRGGAVALVFGVLGLVLKVVEI